MDSLLCSSLAGEKGSFLLFFFFLRFDYKGGRPESKISWLFFPSILFSDRLFSSHLLFPFHVNVNFFMRVISTLNGSLAVFFFFLIFYNVGILQDYALMMLY